MQRSKRFLITVAGLVILASPGSARDSATTRQETDPLLVWDPYGWAMMYNEMAMPEETFKENVDWIDTDFKKHGFKYIRMPAHQHDITHPGMLTANGYPVRYHSSWQHTYAWWADYMRARDMHTLVYEHNVQSVNDVSIKLGHTVTGTDTPLKSLMGSKRTRWNDGAYVDVTRPGAEQYIKGWISHYKGMGMKGIILDWLTDVPDADVMYKWMKEEAGDDFIIWALMNPGKDGSVAEMEYLDIRRVAADARLYDFFQYDPQREGRAQHEFDWRRNLWEGLTFFSDYSGRGLLINDADAIELYLQNGRYVCDERKKCMISLWVLSGSPVVMADYKDTISSNARFYTQPEMLRLVKSRFTGKAMGRWPEPLCSQRWAGQHPDGTWVLGLFNRVEDPYPGRTVEFDLKQLGVHRPLLIRDLWAEKDIAQTEETSVNGDLLKTRLPPQGCKVFEIQVRRLCYEAEVATFFKGSRLNKERPGFSAFGAVKLSDNAGAGVLWHVDSASRRWKLRYALSGPDKVILDIQVNGRQAERLTLAPSSQDGWSELSFPAALDEGVNRIQITRPAENRSALWLDCLIPE